MEHLEDIPVERLAGYVEGIADVLKAEGEEKVEELEVRPGQPYLRILARLERTERLQLSLIRQIEGMGERLASNRRKGVRWAR